LRVAPEDPRLRWHRTTLEGRLAVYGEAGDGPPLIFLHGWGITGRVYARVLPVLAATGAHVIAPALPGFGRSEELPGQLTWEKLAHWVEDLLEHLVGDEPTAMVGHSLGGGVATMAAWHHPERVRSLTLVNSVGGSTWHTDRSLAERPLWDWGLHLPAEWARREYRRVLPVVARDLFGNLLRNPRNLVRAGRLAAEADMRAELGDLRDRGVPVTILWGDQDRVLPEAAFLSLAEAAGCSTDIVPGRHSWLIADPEGFGEVITNSLAVHAMVQDHEEEGDEPPAASA
jgi:pimeloyl-ACP methyl ester carboxylesterase